MNVLILCSSATVYVVQLIKYSKQYYPDAHFSLLTFECNRNFYLKNLEWDVGEHIYFFSDKKLRDNLSLYRTILELPDFDIIHSLWMERYWGRFAFVLKRKAKKWISSVGGSDLFRQTKKVRTRYLQKRLLAQADWFTSETVDTRRFFQKMYGNRFPHTPHTINNFGVDILDYITEKRKDQKVLIRKRLGIPDNKMIVVCGYNAHEEHNHEQIIKALEQLPEPVLRQSFFVFPMTYPEGRDKYINQIDDLISKVTNDYMILTKFMDVAEMAESVIAADVMIHVQTTDQLSSTMLAHMYNGNIVIAGNWLPYESLREKGISFIGVDTIADITHCLENVYYDMIEYKDKCKGNCDIIYGMSSWQEAAKNWHDVYISVIGGEK